MPYLTVPGAELHYETRGHGPLLLFIAGARGSGSNFRDVGSPLSENFTVITYDRRGHSQSFLSGEQDYSKRLERDADDAAELINYVSSQQDEKTVFVLGSSSGAIVACTLLCRHTQLITKLICHEPPFYRALPDGQLQLDKTTEVYQLYRAKGPLFALKQFAQANLAKEDLLVLATKPDPSAQPYDAGNELYWFERELIVYPYKEVPWSTLEQPEVRGKLIMGTSETGSDMPPARAAKAIAERLELGDGGLRSFPGAHIGYITQPENFATRLQQILQAF